MDDLMITVREKSKSEIYEYFVGSNRTNGRVEG